MFSYLIKNKVNFEIFFENTDKGKSIFEKTKSFITRFKPLICTDMKQKKNEKADFNVRHDCLENDSF